MNLNTLVCIDLPARSVMKNSTRKVDAISILFFDEIDMRTFEIDIY